MFSHFSFKAKKVNWYYPFSPYFLFFYFFFWQEGTTKVVFAYHAEDPTSEDDMKKHTFRGAKSILLLNNMDKKQVNETGWQQFYIINRNVSYK